MNYERENATKEEKRRREEGEEETAPDSEYKEKSLIHFNIAKVLVSCTTP